MKKRESVTIRAKRTKSHNRNVKVRSTFTSRPTKSNRIKSKTGKTVSSTKVGAGSKTSRMMIMLKRIFQRS